MASSAAQLTLHWLDRSRAQRVLWLLEELNLQYKLVTYKRLPDNQAPASLKAIHPLGKSPVLEINHPRLKTPRILAESANIIEYVSEHFGPHLIPEKWKPAAKTDDSADTLGEETEEWMRYRFFMNYAEGSLMALIGIGALKNGEISRSFVASFLLGHMTENLQVSRMPQFRFSLSRSRVELRECWRRRT